MVQVIRYCLVWDVFLLKINFSCQEQDLILALTMIDTKSILEILSWQHVSNLITSQYLQCQQWFQNL